ncbi:MAG: Gfo/Idh/MocA family oxidoreductase [Rhodospirillaceae bacterium]|nr:Gfo/Idh/MocA family oxidoreductase [Rhodospirillaceae bacterium]MYF85169.1 Gfo/Idh/MocA family oxidoreductase [Rhodospirillaceae bacterium]MYH35685.1 Gfo/Idh/MocA family oxidoreductase [Rhodospirillaceae bacterium]MYK12763.1 Gfo/Idh/MocA family oxidoreductase [Rhodospirillaceae bacterium]
MAGSGRLSETDPAETDPDSGAAPVRVAVVGCGYFGALHAAKFAALEAAELVAVVDIDSAQAEKVAAATGAAASADFEAVLDRAEAVSVVTPTTTHYAIAKRCLEAGKDVLVEKPLCETLEEADELIATAKAGGRILQVGHLERFSPIVRDVKALADRPGYIESTRISQYRGRGTDTSVILDMMVHDIDNIMTLVNSPIDRIDAVGVPVVGPAEDIANARIRFENGCVAAVTASRVSWKIQRTMRVFQRNAYMVADMAENRLVVMNRTGGRDEPPTFGAEQREYDKTDLIMMECADFLDCVRRRREPVASGESVRDVLAAALTVTDQLRAWRRELR